MRIVGIRGIFLLTNYWILLLINYSYIHKAIDYLRKKYKTSVLGLYLGPFPTVVACDYDSIRELFSKQEFIGRPPTFVAQERSFKKPLGIQFNDGPLWKYQRRFTLRHMRDFGFGARNVRQESLVQQDIQDMLEVLNGRKQDVKAVKDHLATYSEDYMRDFVDVNIREMRAEDPEITMFSVEQLLIVMLDLLLATLVTVTATMSFAIQYLLSNPEIQAKLQKELDSVVGRDKLPSLDDRSRLPYMEAFFREVMRAKPILPLGLARRALEDATLGGYSVPKNTIVVPNLYAYNTDPAKWGDPHNFRPERFIDEYGEVFRKDTTFPFGGGMRVCAGETFARHHMFLIMASLLQNFSFVIPQGGKMPDTRPLPGIVLLAKDFWVKTETRN